MCYVKLSSLEMRALDYLKNIYNLHVYHVEWAIIVETVRHKIQKTEDQAHMLLTHLFGEEKMDEYEEERTLKLGLFIKGSRVYVDLICASVFLNGECRYFGAKGLSCKTCVVR